MSFLPATSAVTGALGFFAGAAGGASLATTMGVCCLGGVILWPFGILVQLSVGYSVGNGSMIFPLDCMASIPASGLGALVCSMPVVQVVVAASVGAALLYLLGQVIYINKNDEIDVNEEQEADSCGFTLSIAGFKTNF
ncbi:MAG: hypothetical protein P1U36_09570 [Legionellaceae bacterium]|nr:hypothetical protein [Legionellaceae bacterium]